MIVPRFFAETAGAMLMDLLGPFELHEAAGGAGADGAMGGAAAGGVAADEGPAVALIFYPPAGALPTDEEILAALPADLRGAGRVRLERCAVARDWVEGWKDHFKPVVIGEVRIRPPWEAPPAGAAAPPGAAAASLGAMPLVDVVINPGLGFGTGLHPTTRGVLRLMQGLGPEGEGHAPAAGAEPRLGPLVDAGTGSGILAIAAAKLGWGPIFAFDNDPEALKSARENMEANGVGGIVEVHRAEVAEASPFWSAGATVLANMTLDPVLALVRKIARDAPTLRDLVADGWPYRLVVSGILAGDQERELVAAAAAEGFAPGRRVHEGEWVSMELWPARAGGGGSEAADVSPSARSPRDSSGAHGPSRSPGGR